MSRFRYVLLLLFSLLALPVLAQEEPPAVEEKKPRKVINQPAVEKENTDRVTNKTPLLRNNVTRPLSDSTSTEPGFLNIIINSEVDALVAKNRYVQQNKNALDGWRIQIIQATDKRKVLQMRSRVKSAFPEYEDYLDYAQPYFKLRIGNFTDRYQAEKAHKEVSQQFSRAFLVNEQIPIEKAMKF